MFGFCVLFQCQIAAVLLYYRRRAHLKGRLLQVGTGEGKSIIVYLIASVEVLLNKKQVDVVTSQELLAKAGFEDHYDLYHSLGIEVGYLDPEESGDYPRRRWQYSNWNVVYGTASQFMGDMLQIEENLRENRKCQVCIIDEVDNSFIDTVRTSTLLTTPTAGTREFNLIFMMIWVQLKQAIQGMGHPIVMDDGLYFMMKNAALINVLWDYLKDLSLFSFTSEADETNKTNKIDTIISFLLFKIEKSNLLKDKKFRVKYGFDAIMKQYEYEYENDNQKDEEQGYVTLVRQVEMQLRNLIVDPRNVYKFLSLLSNKYILNCKISLYDLYNESRVVFKAYFENGDQFNESKNTFGCDFVLVNDKNVNNGVIKVLHYDKNRQMETTTKRQIYKMVLKKIGVSSNSNVNGMDHADDDEYIDNISCISSEKFELIPQFFKEYAKEKCYAWVCNAWKALLELDLSVDYVIKDGKIKVIEKSTGTVYPNMHWVDGLHQFLQLKHDLKMENMNFSSLIMTKAYFFMRYTENGGVITGLTGTLGGNAERNFYQNIFGVDCINIPSFAAKPLVRHNDLVCSNTQEWLNVIGLSCYSNLLSKKCVLIICSDIRSSEMIFNMIENGEQFIKYKKHLNRIFKYTRDDNTSNTGNNNNINCNSWIKNEITCGDVIVATNLAGRGTDIKLDKQVTKYGGLHVIVAFEPENGRILKQNIGRTCRSGHPGSAIIIINAQTCDYYYGTENIKAIKTYRQQCADHTMSNLEYNLNCDLKREEYFTRFVELMQELDEKYWHKVSQGVMQHGDCGFGNNCCTSHPPSKRIFSPAIKKQAHYKWSLLYPKIECWTDRQRNKSEVLWQEFETQVRHDLDKYKHKICYNPFYLNNAAFVGDIFNGLDIHQRKEMVDIVCDKGDYVGNHGISYFIKACIIMQENRYSLAKQAREEASQYLAKANEYFDLLKNRCDAWYALYTTVKMVNGGEYKDKTDFDRMIRMERCIFWEIVQESCNDCLKHINDREIEISFIPVREYFASQKLKFKSEFNLNIEVDDCIVSNYMECGLMYLMVIESTRKKRIYKNNTIETASRRVNRWKRIYFTAMGQMLHICQVIGGVILVTFSGGVVSFLGKHCIERAVDKIVGEIEKLFGDGFNFSQLWKRDLMIELIGLIAISVKAWNGPKLKEMVPTNVRQALDMEDISDSDCLNGIMAKQVAVDETGLDMFSVYNSIKNGSMKKDNIIITNSGVIKHLRKFDFELEKDAKFNFYGNSTSKSSNFSAVNAISNKEYIRGSYDCGMSGVMKCTKYSSIINDAIKNPILKNGIRLVSNVFSDFCTHMNNPDKTGFISCYIKCMVESHTGSCGITFVDICQDVQKLIMQFDAMDRICIGDGNGINDCENSDSIMQFTSILSNVMCLIEELGRLNKQESNKMKGKQDEKENIDRTTMRQIIDRIHNIGEIAAYCTRSSNVNPFEYILCLVHNAMYLVYKKGKPSRSELLRLGCDMYGSSKLKPIDKMARYMTKIERKCASKSITCQDFLSVIGKSINIVFERKTTIFKDTKNLLDILMDAYGIYSNKRYYISFDNNAFKICDSVFNMIFNSINRNESMAVDWKSQFKCIGKIITMLNYYTMNARENQLEVIKYVLEKLEKFFIIDNKIFETNENTSNNGYIYKKQLINFYNICKRITAMIERSININQGFRVNELHRELAEIGGMFSSEHETTVNEYFKHLQSIIHPSTTVQPACQVGRVLVRDSIRRHLRARAPPVYTTSYTAIAQIMITKVNPIANEVDNDSNRRDNSYPNSKKMHTVQDVLKCIVQCQNSFIYNTFSFVELFDIVYAFRNLCKNETNEKNEEIIIFDRISELHAKIITEMISIRQDITKNRGIISIVDVLKLMDMLVNIHSNAQGIESVEYGKHIIECSEYMSQLCSNFTKDLNESKVENENEYYDDNECTLRNYLSIPLQFVTSELFKNMAKGAFGNEMTSNLVINIISNVLNHFINIDENPTISSLIEFIKFVEKTMKGNINVDDTQDASIEKSNGHVELFIDNCSFSENINFGIEREIDFLINCFDNIRYTNIIGDSTLNEIGKWYQQARNRDPSVKKKEMSRYIKSLTTRWVEKCIHKFMKSLQDFYPKRI